jgi:hypothetical protein
MRPLFQEIGRIALRCPRTQAEHQPGSWQGPALLETAEGLVEQTPEPVAHHGPLAHLAADDHRQAAGVAMLWLGRMQ